MGLLISHRKIFFLAYGLGQVSALLATDDVQLCSWLDNDKKLCKSLRVVVVSEER